MAPSAIVDALTPQTKIPVTEPSRPEHRISPQPRRPGLFDQALLEDSRIKSSSKTLDLLIAFSLHAVLIGVPILAGLYYTDTLNLKDFTSTFLVAPAPPPPPPPPPAASVMRTQPPRRVFMQQGKLMAPSVIPQKVAEIKEAPIAPDAFEGVAGGVPGGVPGGQMGGVIGGVIGGVPGASGIAPPKEPAKIVVRVGGKVRPPRAVYRPAPAYPPLAKQARVSGDVVVDTILDENGNVTNMKILSGPPLLYEAAMEALKQWRYQPTYLNDQPVSVELIVTINFQLSN